MMMPPQLKRHNHTTMMRLARAPKLCDVFRSVSQGDHPRGEEGLLQSQTLLAIFNFLNKLGGVFKEQLSSSSAHPSLR